MHFANVARKTAGAGGLLRTFRPSTCQTRSMAVFSTVTDSLVSLHEMSSLPWLFLVPATTFGLRMIFTLPPSIWQRKRIIKQQELRKVVQATPPVVKLRLAAATQRQQAKLQTSSLGAQKPALTPEQITLLALKETRNRQKKLFAENNVPLWKNAILPLIQVPLWVSVSMGLRKLTEHRLIDTNLTPASSAFSGGHVDDLISQMATIDLSLPLDSLPMLAPLALGLLALMNVENNSRMMTTTATGAMGIKVAPSPNSMISQSTQSILNISRLSCIFFMGVATQAPLLLSAYWTSSQLFSLVQNAILDWLWPYQK
ncbi:LAME_0F02080g1_1 [Lachancea meyersii CBS 8951]|uniref:LAME_0F02080g1_1 n=1 Tax=Lachancea meyersii CBS 8951 TaxID=1266667 RepID=A0A1G4JQ64_9SACH|nr:LAME_0F02080g1_1 [Lachancea meyersii CBS 8951]